jgi:hypothetical protein
MRYDLINFRLSQAPSRDLNGRDSLSPENEVSSFKTKIQNLAQLTC